MHRAASFRPLFCCAFLALGLTACNTGSRSDPNGAGGAAPGSTAQYQVAVVTSNGQVAIDPATGPYAAGTSITLTATPDAGMIFQGWAGDLAGQTGNPLAVTVSGDLNVVAQFGAPAAGAPAAAFDVTPTADGMAPFTASFTDTSTQQPTSWLWDFGDGATSTDQHPIHTYNTPGRYTVTLSTSNQSGPGAPLTRTDLILVVDASAGSRHWYQNDTYGNPYKAADAGEASLAQQVLALVNQERANAGVAPLQLDAEAEVAAQVHAEDMQSRLFFNHVTPEGWTVGDRLQMTGASGYTTEGENIAMGQQTAADVMAAWMASAGHRANILSPNFTHIGVGVAQNTPFWAQVFLQR